MSTRREGFYEGLGAANRGYKNRPMSREEAVNVCIDCGLLVQPTHLDIALNGEGWDVILPAESLARLYCRGIEEGQRQARYERGGGS